MLEKIKQLKKIEICGHFFDVIFDASQLKDKEKHWSEADIPNHRIIFNPDCPDDWLVSCFIHEIIEVANFICGMELSHQSIHTLEALFYQIIRGMEMYD